MERKNQMAFLQVSATKIIDISKIERVKKSEDSTTLSVIYTGNTATVWYSGEEAQILWEYLESTSIHLLEE